MQQLQNYLAVNELYPDFQSAYRKHHSCETALLRVFNNLLLTVDDRKDAGTCLA